MSARRRSRLLERALIDLYDFLQVEFEAEPYANEVGAYISDPEAATLANEVLIGRDAAMIRWGINKRASGGVS